MLQYQQIQQLLCKYYMFLLKLYKLYLAPQMFQWPELVLLR